MEHRTPRQGRRSVTGTVSLVLGHSLPALLFIFLIGSPLPSLAADGVRLEQIDYLRNGHERQAVGEVMIAGDRVRLRLFSDTLANHYEVWLPLEDFLGAAPVEKSEAERIRLERDALVSGRIAEREVARLRRLAERERAATKEAARKTTGSTRGSRSDRDRDSEEGSSEGGSRAGRLDGEQAIPSNPKELVTLAIAIDERCTHAAARASELLGEIAERLRDARHTRHPLRELAGEIEDAESILERVARGVAGRKQAVDRMGTEIASGELRGRGLEDQVEFVASQLAGLHSQLKRAEVSIQKSADGLAKIAVEEPLPPEVDAAEVAATEATATADLVAAPTPSSSRDSARPQAVTVPSPAPASGARVEKRLDPRDDDALDGEAAVGEEAVSEAEDDGSFADPIPARESGSNPPWLVYSLAALSVFLLWRGSRRRGV